MIGGLKNLAYLSAGLRTYGKLPVLARPRGQWEFQFIFKGAARPSNVALPASCGGVARLYVAHPDSLHGWTDDREGVSEIFVLQFNEVPDELAVRVESAKPLVVELDNATADRISRQLQDVRRATESNDLRASLKVQRVLVELCFLALSERADLVVPNEAHDRVNRTLHWFEENLVGNPTVAAAARAVGVSPAHLRRLFAEAGHPAPQEELVRLRMEAAQRCLLEGWTQKAVAELFGFSEISAFARAFRNFYGSPPSRWLKDHQRKP